MDGGGQNQSSFRGSQASPGQAYTIFLSGQRFEAILEVSREIFSTFCGLFLLLSFKQRDV